MVYVQETVSKNTNNVESTETSEVAKICVFLRYSWMIELLFFCIVLNNDFVKMCNDTNPYFYLFGYVLHLFSLIASLKYESSVTNQLDKLMLMCVSSLLCFLFDTVTWFVIGMQDGHNNIVAELLIQGLSYLHLLIFLFSGWIVVFESEYQKAMQNIV